jgi:circadian clock protein KaiC
VQSIAHGVILLEQMSPRTARSGGGCASSSIAASSFRGGFHDFDIRSGGLEVYPRLVAAEHRQPAYGRRLPSGVAELDRLLGGGIEQGTSTLVHRRPGHRQVVTGRAVRGEHRRRKASMGRCSCSTKACRRC